MPPVQTEAIFSNQHWVLEHAALHRLLIVRRTEVPHVELSDIGSSLAQLASALDRFERRRFSLLLDVRLAPPRNDPEFEEAAADQPAFFSRDFVRSAILVCTAIGRLQVSRRIQEQRVAMAVFNDEAEALQFLCEHGASCRPSEMPPSRPGRR